jgi:hypothetical protein
MRTMATVLLATLCLCVAAAAAGPVLVITDGGYQVMSVGADGKATLQPVGQVVDMRGTPPGPPVTPDTSDPIASQVKGWAAEIADPTSAQALTIVYREVAKMAPGQPRDKVMQALRQASDSVLTQTGGTEKWKGWRAKVSGLIDAQEAAVDYAKLCNSIANGLESSAPAAMLDPALLTLIIQAIIQIITLIFGLGGGGTGV